MKRYLIKASALTALMLLLVATPALAVAPTFGPQDTYQAGPGPIDIANADFNGDGVTDLVTSNRFGAQSDDATVFLGNADGTFQNGQGVFTGVSTVAVVPGDFNGDGSPDIAVADPDSTNPDGTIGSVDVVFNNGDGTFGQPAQYPSGNNSGQPGFSPSDVSAGDFNGDGDLDLAATNPDSDTVGILNNRGDGTFNLAQEDRILTLPAGSAPRSLDASRDVNRDGDPDIVVANVGTNNATVFFGTNGNRFTQEQTRAVGDNPVNVLVSDLNGDGRQDFVTANSQADSVSVLLNRGNGTFLRSEEFQTGDTPFGLDVADFDGDGNVDIAAANNAATNSSENAGSVSILRGDGAGNFGALVNRDVGDGPASVTVADFDSANGPDFATANFGDDDPSGADTVTVRLNTTETE